MVFSKLDSISINLSLFIEFTFSVFIFISSIDFTKCSFLFSNSFYLFNKSENFSSKFSLTEFLLFSKLASISPHLYNMLLEDIIISSSIFSFYKWRLFSCYNLCLLILLLTFSKCEPTSILISLMSYWTLFNTFCIEFKFLISPFCKSVTTSFKFEHSLIVSLYL